MVGFSGAFISEADGCRNGWFSCRCSSNDEEIERWRLKGRRDVLRMLLSVDRLAC